MAISNRVAEAQAPTNLENVPLKAPERVGAHKKADIVDLIRLTRKDTTFGLLPQNQKFLAEVVEQQYTAMKKILSKTPPGVVPPGTQEFITDFESINQGLTPDKIGDAAQKYISDAKHIAAAIKIADWQAQVLQVSSGAVFREHQPTRAFPPVEHKYTEDTEGNIKATRKGLFTPLKEALHWANTKRKFKIDFVEKNKYGGVVVDAHRQWLLTPAQLAYFDEISATPKYAADVETIEHKLIQYAGLRYDFYGQIDPAHRGDVKVGFVERNPTDRSKIIAKKEVNTRNFLSVEDRASALSTPTSPLNSMQKTGVEMRLYFEDLQKEAADKIAAEKAATNKKLAQEQQDETKRVAGEQHTQTMLNASVQADKLRRPIALSADQEQKRIGLAKEITDLSAQKGDVENAVALAKELEALKKEETSIIGIANLPVAEYASLKVLTDERNVQQAVADSRLNSLQEIRQPYLQVAGAINEILSKKGALTPNLKNIYDRFIDAQDRYAEALSLLQETKAKMANKESIIVPHKNQFDRLDEITQLLVHKQQEIDRVVNKCTILATGGKTVPDRADIEAYLATVKTNIDTKQKGHDAIAVPDQTARTWKAEDLEEAVNMLVGTDASGQDKISAINDRAILLDIYNADPLDLEPVDVQRAEEFNRRSAIYKDYPPAYLRTMQILYGPQILMPGQEEQFKHATNALSPDVWTQLLNDILPASFSGEFDPYLKDEGFVEEISPRTINTMLNQMREGINSGTFGNLETVRKDRLVALRAINQASIPVVDLTNPTVRAEISHFASLVYHYRDIYDLADKIFALAPSMSSTTVTLTLTSPEEAIAYARVIDSERQAQLQGL